MGDIVNEVSVQLAVMAIVTLAVGTITALRKKGFFKALVAIWAVGLWTLILIAVFLIVIFVFWPDEVKKSVLPVPTAPPYPNVTLISMRFMSDDYNPRLIDFRTAATDGVPIRRGISLKLQDLWAWSSESSTEYSLVAELYAYPGEKFLGSSETVVFLPKGAFAIGNLKPENYVHGEVDNAWMAQYDWESLSVVLVLFEDGKPVKRTHSLIKINNDGTSWLWDTPHAQIIYITYLVNGEVPQVLDLHSAASIGISVKTGDTIILQEVWYKSDSASGTHQIKVGGYLSSGTGYDAASELYSEPNAAQSGVNELSGFESVSWQVRPDDKFWVLSLVRSDDRTLLDRYYIPLDIEDSAE